jgi:phosphatidylglycerol---prolipoprotein diacylglyceryl transferase
MAPTKNKKKSRPRGASAARADQPQTRRGTAPAAASSGPAQDIPAGLTSPSKAPPGPVPADPGLLTGGNLLPDLARMPARPASPASVRLAETALTPSRGTVRTAPPPADTAGQTPPQDDPAEDIPQWAVKAVEGVLTPTYWLDPGQAGEPFTATVRFSGRRTGVTGKLQPRDSFWQEETVTGIVPGSGPVAVTAEVRGISPGEWTVTGRSVDRAGGRPCRSYPPPGHDPDSRCRAPWPRRVGIPAESTAALHTTSLLRSKVPGIIRFGYATLAALGVLAGLALEALLLSAGHYPLLRPMLFSVIAIVAGVIGGKSWYIAVHRGRKADGWCIQGFVAGAAVVVAAAALAGTGLPAGAYLAAAGPALLIGMAIGRPGCFWAGCCTGRPTAARWGIWSSDRRLGCRRAPAQLLEALAALISGGAVLAVVMAIGLVRSGPAALAGLAAYTLGRQFILGLRSEARAWRYGRPVTAAIASFALIAGVIFLLRG